MSNIHFHHLLQQVAIYAKHVTGSPQTLGSPGPQNLRMLELVLGQCFQQSDIQGNFNQDISLTAYSVLGQITPDEENALAALHVACRAPEQYTATR